MRGGVADSHTGGIIVRTARMPFFDNLCAALFLLPLVATASACSQDVARSRLLESRVYLSPDLWERVRDYLSPSNFDPATGEPRPLDDNDRILSFVGLFAQPDLNLASPVSIYDFNE
jgi:hypothetical protein